MDGSSERNATQRIVLHRNALCGTHYLPTYLTLGRQGSRYM